LKPHNALRQGKDPDTTVRIAGPTADVELVYSRLKAFIKEQ
jgi:effector-binding domain-containing protein